MDGPWHIIIFELPKSIVGVEVEVGMTDGIVDGWGESSLDGRVDEIIEGCLLAWVERNHRCKKNSAAIHILWSPLVRFFMLFWESQDQSGKW